MTALPLSGGSYWRTHGASPRMRILNMFIEPSDNAPDGPKLMSRPGSERLLDVGIGPVRTIFSLPDFYDGDAFVVSGDQLCRVYRDDMTWEVLASGLEAAGVPSIVGTRVVNTETLYVADDRNLLYYQDGVIGTIPTPDDAGASHVCTLGGFVVFSQPKSQRIWFIRPAEVTVDGLSRFASESTPDKINQMFTFGDNLYVVGSSSVEAFYLSGDADAPFARSTGRVLPVGGVGGTAAVLPSAAIVVGTDNVVYSVETGEVLSDPGITEIIRRARGRTSA